MNLGSSSTDAATAAITSDHLDLIWGAAAIAAVIGKTPRATFHILEQGQIPARKIGGKWCASRRKLQEHFEVAA